MNVYFLLLICVSAVYSLPTEFGSPLRELPLHTKRQAGGGSAGNIGISAGAADLEGAGAGTAHTGTETVGGMDSGVGGTGPGDKDILAGNPGSTSGGSSPTGLGALATGVGNGVPASVGVPIVAHGRRARHVYRNEDDTRNTLLSGNRDEEDLHRGEPPVDTRAKRHLKRNTPPNPSEADNVNTLLSGHRDEEGELRRERRATQADTPSGVPLNTAPVAGQAGTLGDQTDPLVAASVPALSDHSGLITAFQSPRMARDAPVPPEPEHRDLPEVMESKPRSRRADKSSEEHKEKTEHTPESTKAVRKEEGELKDLAESKSTGTIAPAIAVPAFGR